MTSLLDFLPFQTHKHHTAIIEQTAYRTRRYTYSEVEKGALHMAASLRQLGIQSGDRVILWGENSARWMMTFYACLMQHIVVVPIDAGFSESFVNKVRSITNAKLICSDRNGESWDQLLQTEETSPALPAAEESALLEIIFTSGTTGEPKGVMITHGNVLSNLVPIRSEYEKYKLYTWPFAPIRFVHLIPLSHLFGQVMGLFLPQMLAGEVIFTEPAATRVIHTVKSNRASVIVCVPQELNLLRKYLMGRSQIPAAGGGVLHRWWVHRGIHRQFGWKFWAFIVGGATLPEDEERFWADLGYAVIQGYGLTETAPAIAITHPFKGIRRGAVGRKLPGLDVKIAEDGEILVRGPNVTPGYYGNEAATREAFSDGWLHTGDLGQFDEQGNLKLLGRKKEVIVTSEGLNVFPQDVETKLNTDPRVKESAVVPAESEGRTHVHAVVVLEDNVVSEELPDVIKKANDQLESFQRIQTFTLWPERVLPRTSTGKLKRMAIAQGTVGDRIAEEESMVQRLLSGKTKDSEELELSSLDRVELMVELEEQSGVELDDRAFASARTAGEITKLLKGAQSEKADSYPKWNWPHWLISRFIRYVTMYALLFPVLHRFARVEVTGLEHLKTVQPPVLFISNHQSLLDVPVILRALPYRWRHLLAPAMGTGRTTTEIYAAGLFFNAYPLPGSSVGLREAIQHTGRLADRGYTPLVFPEGARTKDGALSPFRPGIGVIAKQTMLTVVPIHLSGLFEIWPIHAEKPLRRFGTASVHFGAPMQLSGKEPLEIVRRLEAEIREMEANHRGTETQS